MRRIYFLCTGNSCRSQMAEGYARQMLAAEVQSAGVEAHGLNPMAVQVMAEDGIDISHQQSTLIDPEFFAGADLVVTLCGDAQDRCPTIPQGTHHLHWDLPDAAQAHGDQAAILEMFRTVRDQIKQEIQTLAD